MFAHQYFNMCKEAKDELELIRILNSTPREEGNISLMEQFVFKRGDYFHHPKIGEDKVKVVKQMDSRNLRAVDDPRPFRKNECIWIPTADQLIEEASHIPFSIMNKEDLKKYYEGHVLSDLNLSDEERVLSYFMEHHDKKVWDFDNQKWINLIS